MSDASTWQERKADDPGNAYTNDIIEAIVWWATVLRPFRKWPSGRGTRATQASGKF